MYMYMYMNVQVNAVQYLLNRKLFSSHLCHLGNGVHVGVQAHFQTLGEGEGGLGLDVHAQILTQLLPVPAWPPHPETFVMWQGDICHVAGTHRKYT